MMSKRGNPMVKRIRPPIESVDSTVVGAPNLLPERKKPTKPKRRGY